MLDFTLYGIGDDEMVVSSERIVTADLDEAIAVARRRLERFPAVEVWQAAVCVYRSRKGPGRKS